MVTFNFQLSIFNLLIFLAVGVSSCDDDARTAGGSTGEGSRTVTFTLRLSGQAGDEQLGATRAMSGDEEEQVGHIHVLAFVEKSPGRFIYAYRAKGKNITQSGGSVQFKVDLRQYGERQKFVVLANSEPFLALNTLDSALDTDEIDDFLPRLIVRSDAEWKAHNTSPSDPADLIPMYGLSPSAETITQSTTSLAPGILLIRMLARLDVSVQSSAANFRLVSAQLFNRKNMGYAAYKEINWNATDQKVTAADMPTGASGFATTKLPGVVYPADASTPPAITRSIYTFETGGVTAKDKATALVVGGYYDYPANQSEVTYYRVDIPRFTAAGTEVPDTYGDILRNHLYHIKIKSVTQKGAKTAEEAFDGFARVEAQIVPWNLADMDNVKFEGMYGLKVNKSQFIARKSGATNQQLTVFTDYDEGWTATLVPATAAAWITFAPGTVFSGAANTTATLTFNILANGTQQVGRHAVLRVRAGGITKYVDIFQADDITGDIFDWSEGAHEAETPLEGPFSLHVSRSECRYAGDFGGSGNTMSRAITVTATTGSSSGSWTAVSSDPSWVTLTTASGAANGSPTSLSYTIAKNTTLLVERTAIITITVGNVKKEITITQYPGVAVWASNIKSKYADAGLDKFKIASKCPWTAQVQSDPGNVIEQLRTSSGVADPAGSDFEFSLFDGASQPVIRFKPIPADGEFEYYDVQLDVETAFDLAGLWVYLVDQPMGYDWYVYSNTPDGVNEFSVPPASGTQVNPPREYSCAALQSSDPAKPWRLPTRAELGDATSGIYKAAVDGGGVAKFGFASYYWSASTRTTSLVDCASNLSFDYGIPSGYYLKTIRGYRARCVRSK